MSFSFWKGTWITQLLVFSLYILLSTATSSRPPRILWAQRRHLLYLRVVIPELVPSSLQVWLNDTHVSVSGESADGPAQYAVQARLFRKIEPAGSSWEANNLGEIQFILQKFWEWRYWPRLLHTYDPDSEIQQSIQVDWKRWKPEFDDNTNEEDEDLMAPGEDSDWLDDEVAVKKPANFVDESFNRTHLALLDDDRSLRSFLQLEGGQQQLATVLFFERSYSKRSTLHRQLFRLFAATANIVHKKVAVGSVDAKASSKLMRKMRLTAFPAAKLFFPNGDMFDFNPSELKNVKGFATFLFRQLNPAWITIKDTDMLVRVFLRMPRVLLGIFDDEERIKAEDVADVVAKTYRAMPEPPPVLFARLSTTLLPDIFNASVGNSTVAGIMERIGMEGLVSEGFRGVVLVKEFEEPQKYTGPMKKDALTGWVYARHFNALEQITPNNFNEFRRRKIPVLYILLDDEVSAHEGILDWIRPLAKEYYGRISFVYTRVSGSGDLMDHLRCEYQGVTFAVMEDFVDEYRYCADATPTKPLTPERLRRLAEGVLANSLKPDKVASERVPDPKKNIGPVFDVVADNLMETVMDYGRDVVVHFYAPFDEKWDEDEFELEKVAEAVESAPALKITKINGISNEKPSDFPEVGYIPCTWMFPANDKHNPRYFNKTIGGFTAENLLKWIKAEASHPVEAPGLSDTAMEPPPDAEMEKAATTSKPPPVQQPKPKPNPQKSKSKAKLDDVMKELNNLRKEMKKDEL